MELRFFLKNVSVYLVFQLAMLAMASPIFADLGFGRSTMVAILKQQTQLDEQIGRMEQSISMLQQESSNITFLNKSDQTTSLRISSNVSKRQENSDEEVPMLDEYTIEDTYLDPFDEVSQELLKDPWEGFNASVFNFNLGLDRRVIRPVARGYHAVMPDVAEEALGNAFSNIRVVPLLTNNVLQGKVSEAGVVVGRFLINSTLGLAGLFDVAGTQFGLAAPAEEDAGQTLAKLGVGAGPYLVLPLLPPTTVRDGFGFLADLALDPVNYVLPFVAQASKRVGETVNSRAQNLEQFEGIEDGTLDLYAAVRDAYGQTRAQAIGQ